MFALQGGADGFSRFTGEMVLHFSGIAHINIISYTICHILKGMVTAPRKSQLWEWKWEGRER